MPGDETEMPDASAPQYQSYLLRLWQETPGGEQRVLLQDVLSEETRPFSSLEGLFAFLEASRARSGSAEGGGLE